MAARDGAQPQQQQGCVSSPYDYLQPQPEFSTFLRNANQLGAAALSPLSKCSEIAPYNE